MIDYTKLTYEEWLENPEFWMPTGVGMPQLAQDLYELGYKGISALDFYSDIFGENLEDACVPEDYRTGQYGGILIEVVEKVLTPKEVEAVKARIAAKRSRVRLSRNEINGQWVDVQYSAKRYTITNGFDKLFKRINETDNFLFMSPISYAGKQRTNENARYLHALCIEIDNIKPETGIKELIHIWNREWLSVPVPTFIVCSGNGLHLYWVFERPVPLFANIFEQISAAKHHLTERLWSKFVTDSYDKIQYESLGQGFRCVGASAKDKKIRTVAFQIGEKITLEELNRFLPEDKKINVVYKSNLPLEEAKKLYPKWYQRRIVEKNERGHYYRNRGIYDNWIKKILDEENGAKVGHRYNCLENLCSLAVQCRISPEEVEKDCRKVAEALETLTIEEKNHFTEYDIDCALQTYHRADEKAFRRNIDNISKKTDIPLQRAKRNGRKQADHLRRARAVQQSDYPDGEWRGNKSKRDTVMEYLSLHPDETPTQIAKALGITRPTVYKYIAEERKRSNSMEGLAIDIVTEHENNNPDEPKATRLKHVATALNEMGISLEDLEQILKEKADRKRKEQSQENDDI